MKGLEQAPMRDVEEQLRGAFGAAADTITVQDLPGLPAPDGRARVRRLWGWAPRLRTQPLVPVAAAAGVALAVAVATLVVPGLQSGPAAGVSGVAATPKFFAGVTDKPHHPQDTLLNIYRSATGRVAASIPPPEPYHDFVAVSRLGGDRTFVAAVITAFGPSGCTSHLFRFSIDGQGHPSGLTPLSVPQVSGQVAELVSSAGGKAVAFTVSGCPGQAVGMINLATRQTTTWAVPHHGINPEAFGSLSLTADGSKLGFWVSSVGTRATDANAYVLPTDSPAGPLMLHARKVLHVPTGVDRVVLSNNGSRAYVETRPATGGDAAVLSEYSTATGQRLRVLGQLSPLSRILPALSVTVDASGQHLLVYSYARRLTMVNLTTGHQASMTAAQIPWVDSAYNTVAW